MLNVAFGQKCAFVIVGIFNIPQTSLTMPELAIL